MEERKTPIKKEPHRLAMDGREKLVIEGFSDVMNFDETDIAAKTNRGILLISGTKLNIDRLDKENNVLTVSGLVDKLQYKESIEKSGGLFKRMFK